MPPCTAARLYCCRDVSENKLVEVCEEIGQLASLTRLDLHTNSLVALPAAIGRLSNVKHM